VPSFTDVLSVVTDPSVSLRVAALQDGDDITALALFVVCDTVRRFWLGEKVIARMRLRTATLFGSASLGTADTETSAAMLRSIASDRSIDLLVFADVPQTDYLYQTVTAGGWRGPKAISHHRAARRLAVLPASMDEYWASLRPSTRKAGLRDLRMFERLGPVYQVFTTPDEVMAFLDRAATLSAHTYQQQLGVGLENTERMRLHFARLAGEGRLRCYMASIDGADVAFVWGDLSHGKLYFRTTGFDPAFARYSPGKAILLAVVRDLIETRAATTFDFSGRDMDFKERFSTATLPCANFVLSRWWQPRGVIAVALERAFAELRTLAPRLLGDKRLTQLKRVMRA
jgi:CelD/BcsL family acetyltransferase involved in cellulose biosynthesis